MHHVSPDLYQKKIEEISVIYTQYKKKASSFSWLRTLAFLITVIAAYYYFSDGVWYFAIAAIASFISFLGLVSIQRKYQYQVDLNESKLDLLDEELSKHQLSLGKFDDGLRFSEDNHPYADDLDVFGKHSLFQLLNRCEIEDSKRLMSQWLKNPATLKDINLRQNAVIKLSEKLDWLINFSAVVRLSVQKRKKNDPDVSSKDINAWSSRSLDIKLISRKYLAIALSIVAVCTIAILFYYSLPYFFGLPIIIANLIFIGVSHNQLKIATIGIDGSKSVLDSYEKAIAEVTQLDIASPYYQELKNSLIDTNALESIKELNGIIHRVSGRSNMMYFLLNVVLLFDVHLVVDLEKWRRKYCKNISSWLDCIHQVECLISIAGYHINKSSHNFPELTEKPFHFEAEKLGHPLISDDEKVSNGYTIDQKGAVDILTGSNMSGKSTFQRTVGVSMVLAQIGAPCDAQYVKISPCLVFTSMRTKDNLEEHTSSFYAELKRIRQLLDLVEKETPIFFLVDEILKGTNSEDRHIGAVALAKQLTSKNAFGIISTHDLTLSEVANSEPSVRNFSFNSEIVGDKISFDYKLTQGVCKSFNASQLMRNMGILTD